MHLPIATISGRMDLAMSTGRGEALKNDGLKKSGLSERDICILPARQNAGGDELLQLREEFRIGDGSPRRTGNA